MNTRPKAFFDVFDFLLIQFAARKDVVRLIFAARRDVVRRVFETRSDVVRHVVAARKHVFMFLLTSVQKKNREIPQHSLWPCIPLYDPPPPAKK